jgi:hypothetical protein
MNSIHQSLALLALGFLCYMTLDLIIPIDHYLRFLVWFSVAFMGFFTGRIWILAEKQENTIKRQAKDIKEYELALNTGLRHND